MQRDRSLIPLSHQHQHGLALCVSIERGAPDMDRRVLRYYASEMAGHFAAEEQVLFPACPGAMADGLAAEHRLIESQVDAIRSGATPDLLRRFAATLRAHIRKEENEYFEEVQRRLTREQLDALGAQLLRKESVNDNVLLQSHLDGIELRARGKVRDVYGVGNDLLIVATDRISAFDYILGTGIPDKGRVLTQLSVFWFDFLRDVTPTHFLSADAASYPAELQPFRRQLDGRSMLVRRADMIEIECVARGYLSGSGWKEYQRDRSVCGIRLPEGLKESSKLPEPIFTPATKAQTGHDENVSFETVANLIGYDLAARLRDLTLAIYKKAADYAETRGIIIADTKFEFGFVDGELVLADEVLTPDSSRFWPVESYKAGGAQPSYDKQFVRDYLESIHWNKQPPAPSLPEDVAEKTSAKYKEAYRKLTGKTL